MYGALLTRPERAGSDAGVLFMHNEGYSTMCGHGIIAVATLVFERGLLSPRTAGELVLDSPAGAIHAPRPLRWAHESGGVSFINVPSFVLHAGDSRPGQRPRHESGRGVRRRVLRDRRQRSGGHSRQRPSPRRSPAHGHGDQGGGGVGDSRRASIGPWPQRYLRHHLHRAAIARGCGSSQRHDLRRSRSRSLAVRNGDVCRDGRPRGNGATRAPSRRSLTRASSAAGSGGEWWERRWLASCPRSFRRSKGRPTSPGSTPSTSIRATLSRTDSGSSFRSAGPPARESPAVQAGMGRLWLPSTCH